LIEEKIIIVRLLDEQAVFFKYTLYTVFVIFCIAKGVQHDGRLPFWKPALNVFVYYVCIVIAFAFGKINSLLHHLFGDDRGCLVPVEYISR